MQELKTLKDLIFDTGIGKATDPITLKQEAINWIKAIRLLKESKVVDKDTNEVVQIVDKIKNEYCEGSLVIFKHFFNITDEDLK